MRRDIIEKYRYSAIDKSQKKQIGEVVVANKKELFIYMKERELFCTHYQKVTERNEGDKKSLKFNELVIVSRQLGTMLNSGVSVIKALDVIRTQSESKATKKVFEEIYQSVQKGNMLSVACKHQKGVFPSLFISLIESGEVSGTLDETLLKISAHYEKEEQLKNEMKNAMIYPIVLGVVSIMMLLILVTFIVPNLLGAINVEGQELPRTTRYLINISEYIQDKWYNIIVLSVSAIIAQIFLFRIKVVQNKWDELKIKLPILGKCNQMIISARFSDTLAALYSNGIPLIEALTITGSILSNKYINQKIEKAKEDIIRGSSLAYVIRDMEVFPKMLSDMIQVGEESGKLEEVLESAANFYKQEADTAIKRMIALIEPMLIVVLGIVIAIVIASILPVLYSSFEQIY